MRWLMGAAAVAGLLLALGVGFLRDMDRHLTIRVFNKTGAPLDNLSYQFDKVGPDK